MLIDKCFVFYVKGTGRLAHFLNRIKLFYWRQLRRKNVIGFYMGIPIVASSNLEGEEITKERLAILKGG